MPSGAAHVPTRVQGGACFGGNNSLLIYGGRTVLVDATSGDLMYTFEPERVRRLPIELRSPGEQTQLSPVVSPVSSLRLSSGGYSGWGTGRAQPQTQVLNYQMIGSGSGGQLAAASAAQVTFVLTNQPSVWSSEWQNTGQDRGALLCDRELILADAQGLFITRTDLPLTVRRVARTGTLVGVSGRHLFLLQAKQLCVVDLATGIAMDRPLKEIIPEGVDGPRLQATVAGLFVYVTGPDGILCLNARSLARLYHVPWPENLVSDKTDAQRAAKPANCHYSIRGLILDSRQRTGGVIPLVDRAIDGVLYASVTPYRVAALAEKPPKE